MFGGMAMSLMDEVAFMTATRFCRKRVVTVSSSKIDFHKPIPHGTIIELIGRVQQVGNTSLLIRVQIFMEEMYSETREKVIEGEFTFVAIGDDRKPISVIG
ncbi:MAG: acyl-CoA thioesterase [Saprospiraceae bacterium]|nr:acyl-CoA thioesterase [Saprospiraceae bacterium]